MDDMDHQPGGISTMARELCKWTAVALLCVAEWGMVYQSLFIGP